jgi:hypothetical protein
MTVSLTSPAPATVDDRYVVISDPRPGTIVELGAGSQLGIGFRRGLGTSQWHIAELPGHLVPLAVGRHTFHFLVFGGADTSQPLRLERRHPDRQIVHEVCELLVVPVSGDA